LKIKKDCSFFLIYQNFRFSLRDRLNQAGKTLTWKP
jgi:hypothetical protein